jgi:hypothetical protein
MSNEIKTPRTKRFYGSGVTNPDVAFAEKLERETVELRAEIERICRALGTQIVTALEERDAAKSELKTAVALLGKQFSFLKNEHSYTANCSCDGCSLLTELNAFLESSKTK